MPKRWRIVPSDGTARLSAASGGEGGGGGTRKFKVKMCEEVDDCATLPWEWDSKQEARQAIEGWKKADIGEG